MRGCLCEGKKRKRGFEKLGEKGGRRIREDMVANHSESAFMEQEDEEQLNNRTNVDVSILKFQCRTFLPWAISENVKSKAGYAKGEKDKDGENSRYHISIPFSTSFFGEYQDTKDRRDMRTLDWTRQDMHYCRDTSEQGMFAEHF